MSAKLLSCFKESSDLHKRAAFAWMSFDPKEHKIHNNVSLVYGTSKEILNWARPPLSKFKKKMIFL